MKKLFLILILFTFCSCLGTKKTTEKTSDKVSTEKVETSSDSTSTEVVNKAINDTVKIQVPVSDPEVDAKVDEILRRLNSSKSSGDNSYRFYYDEKLRELRAEFEVGQTSDKVVEKSDTSTVEKTFEEKIAESSKKVVKMLPWWAWLLAAWLLRKQIIDIIALFVPGIRGIKSLSDLLNPPNRDNHD